MGKSSGRDAETSERTLGRKRLAPRQNLARSEVQDDPLDAALSRRLERRRQSRRFRWMAMAAGIALLLLIAPWILGASGLVSGWISSSVSELRGQVSVGGVSLNWLTPPVLHGVALSDPEGRPVVVADQVAMSLPLWRLLLAGEDLGRIRVEGLEADVQVAEGTSNLEQIFAPWLESESSGTLPVLAMDIPGARLRLTSPTGVIDCESADLKLALLSGERTEGSVSLKVGLGEATAVWQGEGFAAGKLVAHGARLPLNLVDAVSTRLGEPIAVEGSGDLELHLEIKGAGEQGTLTIARLDATEPVISAPQWWGEDRPALERASLVGGLRWQGTRLEFLPTRLRTPWGGGDLEGFCDVSDWDAWWTENSEATFSAQGQFSLPPLLQQFRRTLQLTADSEITEGRVDLAVTSRVEGNQRRMSLDLATSPLRLRRQGVESTLEIPLRASATVIGDEAGAKLEFLDAETPFVHLRGAGTWDRGEATWEGDLALAKSQLERLLDLGGVLASGSFGGELRWGSDRETRMDGTVVSDSMPGVGYTGRMTLQAIDVGTAEGPIWQDPRVDIGFGGRWDSSREGWAGLLRPWLSVVAVEDRLEVVPVEQSETPAVQFRLVGDLQRWLARCGMAEPLPGHRMAGWIETTGGMSWSDSKLRLTNIEGRGIRVSVDGPDLRLSEPEVIASLQSGEYSASGESQIDVATLASSAVSLRLEGWAWGGDLEAPRGACAIRCDLTRLTRWFPAWSGLGLTVAGSYEGSGTLRGATSQDQNVWAFEQRGVLQNAEMNWVTPAGAAGAGHRGWTEPRMDLTMVGNFDPARGTLALEQGVVQGTGQVLTIAGTTRFDEGRWTSDLSGDLAIQRHDWVSLLRPWVGDDAELVGGRKTAWRIKGPLAIGAGDETGGAGHWPPRALQAEAALAWEQGRVLGLGFGAGEVVGRLRDQVLDLGQFRMPVGAGRIELVSRITFETPVPRWQIAPGKLLEGVELTSEACRQWIRYAAPLVASTTAVRGLMDIEVGACDLPLTDPLAGSGAGVLQVREAVVGPGPLVEQLLALVATVRQLGGGAAPGGGGTRWMELPPQRVAFQLESGRVYHDRLEARVGDVVLLTTGSVGKDESVELMASVPVQDSWLANRPQLAALRGLRIDLPVRGTLTRPQVDSQALAGLSRRLAEQAAGQVLDQQLQRGLDRLFGGGR